MAASAIIQIFESHHYKYMHYHTLLHLTITQHFSPSNLHHSMASKFIFTTVVLLMLLCLLLMREPSGCSSAYECFGANAAGLREIPNRKVLSVLKDKKTTLKATSLQAGSSSSIKYGEKPLSWELRKVPSGPDPLHHNGVNPNKPQTP